VLFIGKSVSERTPQPELEPLTRTQVLVAMGVTAALLLVAAKLWQYLGNIQLLPLTLSWEGIWLGVGLGSIITLASALVYQIWPAYRRSAATYLQFILKPLTWSDLIWLGLLPGLSEELLFRGVMVPAFGLDAVAVVVSSLCFGILHLLGREQWPYTVWATAVGLLLGGSALVTGNLLVPIVAHITTNSVSSILWKRSQSQQS
jgi:hypothetical protein